MKAKNIILHRKDLALYEDSLGRVYFANKRKNSAYYIPKDKISSANIYGNRFLLLFFLLVVIGFAFSNWTIAIIVGLLCYCVAEILYRFRYLPTLEEVTNIEFEQKRKALEVYAGNSLPKNSMLLLAYIVLPILMIINAIDTIHISSLSELTKNLNSLLLVIITVVVVLFCLFQISRYLVVIYRQTFKK